nr:hypothetical protein [Halomicronema hongdechloris]
MNYAPPAILLAVANGHTHPDIELFPSGFDSTHLVDAVAKGHIIPDREIQVADFIPNIALDGGKPLLSACAVWVCSVMH